MRTQESEAQGEQKGLERRLAKLKPWFDEYQRYIAQSVVVLVSIEQKIYLVRTICILFPLYCICRCEYERRQFSIQHVAHEDKWTTVLDLYMKSTEEHLQELREAHKVNWLSSLQREIYFF